MRSMSNKWVVTIAVLLACVGLVSVVRASRPSPEEQLKKRIAERSFGDPKAALGITEYFDYQCPPCANAYKVLEEAIKKYPGKIYLQARYYPFPAHKNAMRAAICAECAARQKGRFWQFHGKVFQHQSDWANDPYAELKFLTYAQEAGVDIRSWDACLKDPEVPKFVAAEKEKGVSLGVKITPSFFINGKLVVGVDGLATELAKLENKNTASS